MTLRELLTSAAAIDRLHDRLDARRDAERLLAHALGRERTWLLAHIDDAVPAEAAESFRANLDRRAAGEPLQYILGEQEFYGLRFKVTPAVLIPRPETEHLVEAVELWATHFHDGRVLELADVGTGSGAIAVALATHLAGIHVTAVDVSAAALEVARENAAAHQCGQRVTFREGDLLQGFSVASLDAVLSNPPYVPASEKALIQREVVDHEPHTALFAGEDGLEIYRRLIPQAHTALRPRGLLAMEFGFGQHDALSELLQAWNDVRFIEDYAGIPRIVLANR